MDANNFGEVPPPSRTPKSLSRQVANMFALMLIGKTLPALIKYWGIEHRRRSLGFAESEDSDTDDDDLEEMEQKKEEEKVGLKQAKGNEKNKTKKEEAQLATSSESTEPEIKHAKIKTLDDIRRREWIMQETVEHYEPPMPCKAVITEETVEYKQAIAVEEALVRSDSCMVREAVVKETSSFYLNLLTKQMVYVMNLARKGIEALLLEDIDSDSEGFDDDDSDILQVRPRTGTSSDITTSGSGRITTPDVEEVLKQDPMQMEYLHQKANNWVLKETDAMLLAHLQRIKRWYDEVVVIGAGGSLSHYMISEAITEVLDCIISPRICESFHRYNLQVMFCQEVGFLGQNNMAEVPSLMMCKVYANFLTHIAPFSLKTLYTIPMSFAHPAPLMVLIKNSKYLRKISVGVLHCRTIFRYLKRQRRGISEISAFAGGPLGDSGLTESFLFSTFFKGMTMNEVIFAISTMSSARITFKNLERFYLHFISDAHHHFIHCFQYFYPHVKTQFFKLITENILNSSTLRTMLSPPYFLEGKGNLSWHSVYLMTGQFRYIQNPYDLMADVQYPQVRSLSVWQNTYDVSPRAALIREMVTRYGCSSLILRIPYLYLDNEVNIISPYLSTIGEHLTGLHVLSGKSAFHVSELIYGLNACPSLKIMSLDIACFWPVTGMESIELRPMMELTSLSLTAKIMTSTEYNVARENYKLAIFLGKVLLKAPNLKNLELLRTPSDVAFNATTELKGRNTIKTLMIDFSVFLNREERLVDIVENLTSLSHLLLYDVSQEDYSKFKKYFYKTDLQIAFRSTKFLGAGDYPES